MSKRTALPYRYLLDTNIVSNLVRNPQGAVTRRIARTKASAVSHPSTGSSAQETTS